MKLAARGNVEEGDIEIQRVGGFREKKELEDFGTASVNGGIGVI